MRKKNPRTQFELKTMSLDTKVLNEAYEWCKKNLPLKEDKGLQYWIDEIYIITSSQAVINKVNKHFGSDFHFGPCGMRYFIA